MTTDNSRPPTPQDFGPHEETPASASQTAERGAGPFAHPRISLPSRFSTGDRTADILLILATLVLVVTRLGSLAYLATIDPVGDEGSYIGAGRAFWRILDHWLRFETAEEVLLATFYKDGWHPPLNKLVVGASYELGGLALARTAQALIGILAALGFYWMSRLIFGPRAAAAAYVLFVINPYLIAFSHWLWAENIYLLLEILFFVWFFRLLNSRDESVLSWKSVVSGGALIGLLSLTKSSFTLVWLGLSVLVPFPSIARQKRIRLYVLASFLGFLISLPWDLMIYQREGKYSHGTTLGTVHLSIKYNNRGFSSFKPVLSYAIKRAEENGSHYSVEARKMVFEFFEGLDGRYDVVVHKIKDELVEYLVGGSFLVRHFAWGVYPASNPLLNLHVIAYDKVTRYALVFLGLAGITLLGRMPPYARWMLILFVAANSAIVVVGNSNARHLLSSYPFLIVGVVALFRLAIRFGYRGLAVYAAALVLSAFAALTNLEPMFRRSWPAPYSAAINRYGGEIETTLDWIELRPADGCGRSVRVVIKPAEHQRIEVRQRGRPLGPLPAAELEVRRPWVRVRIEQPFSRAQDSLLVDVDGRLTSLPLGAPLWGSWHHLEGRCLEARWRGAGRF